MIYTVEEWQKDSELINFAISSINIDTHPIKLYD